MTDEFDPVVTEPERLALTRISRPTWHRLEAAGDTPPRVQLSPRRVGWRRSDLENWLRGRTAKRNPAHVVEQVRLSPMKDELITCAQLAVMVGRSERTVWRWRKSPDFPKPIALPCAGRVLFDKREIEQFLERQREHAA